MGLRSTSSAAIVRQTSTGQSLVIFYFLSKKWSIGITNTIVRPIQIVESLVDFDCVSNINVAPTSPIPLRDKFKLVRNLMTLIASAIDVAPVESLNVIAVLNVIKSEMKYNKVHTATR